MRKLSIAVLIVGIAVVVALTGCGGGGGGGGGTPNPPPATGNTIVTGTVVDDRTPPRAVKDVVVKLGTLPEQHTDANGRFSFDLGSNARLGDFLGSSDEYVLKVSTSLAGKYYPQVGVFYQTKVLGQGFPQESGSPANIPIPWEVLMASGVTKDLGQIIVQYYDPDDPNNTFPPFPY